MKRVLCAASVFALAVSGQTVWAQDTKTHTESVTKSDDTKVKTESVTGTVKAYEVGKSIKITGPKNKSYSFDLDENATVEGSIAVGGRARVTYKKVNGKAHVTVVSESSSASSKHSSEASAPTSYAESTTKESPAEGKSTKVKSATVIGTVKEFEAGKKIIVTGPKKKNYSFDLDQNVVMSGTVAVGDRVKVTYTKGEHHKKVTLVAAYNGKA